MKTVFEMIHNNHLLVFGAQNKKKEDQEIERVNIKPAKLVSSEGTINLTQLQSLGDYGINSTDWGNNNSNILYIATESEVYYMDLSTGKLENIPLSYLDDIHEITLINDELWISNTGYNEVIALNIFSNEIKRINLFDILKRLAIHNKKEKLNDPNVINVEQVDKFHVNQIFKGFDNNKYALVHHIDGKQIKRYYPDRVLKNQGNGGVINIDSGEAFDLKLYSPHTVTKVNNDYWVFDSANFRINIYNKSWKLKNTINTVGYGRGATFIPKYNLFVAGISKSRKRYLKYFTSKISRGNCLELFDTSTYSSLGVIELEDIEQVSNVYHLSKNQYDKLKTLE